MYESGIQKPQSRRNGRTRVAEGSLVIPILNSGFRLLASGFHSGLQRQPPRTSRVIRTVCLLCMGLLCGGCGPGPAEGPFAKAAPPPSQPYAGYSPARIVITPWTEIKGQAREDGTRRIRVFVRLVDAFGSDIKSPGVFRFELYERLAKSAEPRGKRLMIWPDFDLTAAEQNNSHWQDYVRSYEFSLDFDPSDAGPYVLEATFIPAEGRRLTNQYLLSSAQQG
jgi:hypothetical protein